MKKCRQSEHLPKSASSRSFYKKVPPVGALCKSAVNRRVTASRSYYEKVFPVGALIKKYRQSELLKKSEIGDLTKKCLQSELL